MNVGGVCVSKERPKNKQSKHCFLHGTPQLLLS
jgi:hypothetical protein